MIQPHFVHIHQIKGNFGNFLRNRAVILYLRKVPHPLQNTVCKAGCPTASSGQLHRPFLVDCDAQLLCRLSDDYLQFFHRIKFQPVYHAETIPQRRCEQSGPGGCAYQRKMGQVKTYGTGRRPLADHNIYGVILHGRI